MEAKDKRFVEFMLKNGRNISRFTALLIMEAFLLLCCLALYAKPLRQNVWQGRDLTGAICRYEPYSEEYSLGCYLDQDMLPEGTDPKYIYLTTPEMNLPAGSYQVTLVYDTDDPDQKYSVTSKYRTYPVTVGYGGRLPLYGNELRFDFFSPIRVEGYQVHVDYSGSGRVFLASVSVCETNVWKNMLLLAVVSLSLLADGLILRYRRLQPEERRRARIAWSAIACLTVFASLPLLSVYLSWGDDLEFHLNRIEAIRESLLAGQFPNRISAYWNKGYGYASALLYGEAFLYAPALLRLLGFSVQGAYKCYVIAVNLTTMVTAWLCFRKLFEDEWAALFGAAAYLLAPYRLVCVYQRAAVGEYTALLFFPLIFYGLMRLCEEEPEGQSAKGRAWISLTVGFSGLVQCHVISVLIGAGFTGLFCVAFFKKTVTPFRLLQLCKAAVATILLNFWFLLPFVEYMRLGYGGGTAEDTLWWRGCMGAHGAFFSQMFSLFQSGVGESHTVVDGLAREGERNYTLGGLALAALFYLFYRIYYHEEKTRLRRIGDWSLAFGGLAAFMCTVWFPWDGIQQICSLTAMITRNIQFPWRFLGMASFCLTLTLVSLLCLLRKRGEKWLYCGAALVLGAAFLLSADFFLYSFTREASQELYGLGSSMNSCSIGGGEYLPMNTPPIWKLAEERQVTAGEGMTLSKTLRKNGGRTYAVTCSNQAASETYADLPLLPYKGYVCRDEASGEELLVNLTDAPGKLRVQVPAGYEGTFQVRFEPPWRWRLAEVVSLFTFLGMLLCGILRKLGRMARKS